MTGGRYVGELVRLVFFDYMTQAHSPSVPSSSLPAQVVHSYSFTTTFVSSVIARARTDAELAGELKRRIPPPESSNWAWSPHSAGALRKIAHHVQVRSAGLIAASIIGLLATVGEIALSNPEALTPDTALDEARDTTTFANPKLMLCRVCWLRVPAEMVCHLRLAFHRGTRVRRSWS